MIIIYQEHIDVLETELSVVKEENKFLKKLLEYKSLGWPREHHAPYSTSAPEPTSEVSI